MKRLALKIEHTYRDRPVGTHVFAGDLETLSPDSNPTFTVGSARGADIRLVGQDVASLHAAFDWREDHWALCDLGSEGGTRVGAVPVVELKIDGATVIEIGEHRLRAIPRKVERALFVKDEVSSHVAASPQSKRYHQVVELRHGRLGRSWLIGEGETFRAAGDFELTAPTTSAWSTREVGDLVYKQRLVTAEVLEGTEPLDADTKRSGQVLIALFALVAMIGMFLLKSVGTSKTAAPDNQYTRMIFDGKKVAQKKAAAEKMRQSMHVKQQPTPSAPAAGPKSAPAARVVLNLKSSGLGAMIGKVAARAGKTAILIESAGVAAGHGSAGRALSLGGGSELDHLKPSVGTGTTLKMGGLGTAGKGGGGTGFKGSGALAGGAIGQAEVGVLEDESEVEGGLDKEAIARVIHSKLGEIRYCYERQLSASPDPLRQIDGEVYDWRIGRSYFAGDRQLFARKRHGRGMRASPRGELAVPLPKGGTNVLVTYPFLFKSTK